MNKTVLITGGSSGIGFEMSQYFAKDGYRILWVSLLEEELTTAKTKLTALVDGVEIHCLTKDLSKNEAAQEVFEWTQKMGGVDVLINNAGFGTYGYTNDISMDKELTMIQLNVLNVYKMTRLFLQEMQQKNTGTIINISSNSSFQPVARMNTYASTKAFVAHFSRGLQEELALQKSKVKVMTVCPSAIVDTAFKKASGMDKVKTFNGLAYTTAEEVAKDVWYGFQKNKTFVVSGWKMRWLYAVRGLVPYRVQQYMVQKETERE